VISKGESYVTPVPGYRLPAALRLGPVCLEVADLERSLDYYNRVIGLAVVGRDAKRATLGATGGDVLVELNEVPGATPHPYNRRLGLYHFAILVPTRAALGQFVAHLAAINAYAGQADHYVSEAFYLRDPDGLGIEVYADRARSAWPISNGQLAMGLDPVDMDSLLSEAGQTKWAGMPAGTLIGHVHLHAGDLGETEQFFHRTLGLDVTATLPSALFMSAGGYHHHLGANTWAGDAPRPKKGDARLLEWRMILPSKEDIDAVGESLTRGGYPANKAGDDLLAEDPWGTRLRIMTG